MRFVLSSRLGFTQYATVQATVEDLFASDVEALLGDALPDELDELLRGRCINVVGQEDGSDVLCGEECNPAEQLCHSCRIDCRRMQW